MVIAFSILPLFYMNIHAQPLRVAKGSLWTDGDTFKANGKIFRLAGVDAPESAQAWGDSAVYWIQQNTVSGKWYYDSTGNDLYGRTLVYILKWQTTPPAYNRNNAASQRNTANYAMVSNGWAHWYNKYNNWATMQSAYDSAKAEKRGLLKYAWVFPENWRNGQRQYYYNGLIAWAHEKCYCPLANCCTTCKITPWPRPKSWGLMKCPNCTK